MAMKRAAKATVRNKKALARPAKKSAIVSKKKAGKPMEKSNVGVEAAREGQKAPDFSLPDQDGQMLSAGSLRGQAYVLYFYPRDDTPGCTREACGFRDEARRLDAAGVRVIGVSPDKPESHTRFRSKYDLPFTLLSDVDKQAAKAFGVWVKKQNYGREYMGVERSTFLVGRDGKIKKVWRRVKVDGHVDAVHAASIET